MSGNVRLETDASDDILKCGEGTFNTKNETGEVFDGVLFLSENNFQIRGAVIQKAPDNVYRIKDFLLTTCDNEPPSWSISGSEINIVKEGYGRIKNSTFRIRGIPVFYIPYMIFPAKTKRQTGILLPQFDHSDINGYGIELPFFWAISDHSDATIYERLLTKRGLMQGVEFRYLGNDDSKGEFLFDIIRDKIEKKDLTDRDQAEITPFERNNQHRYWLRGKLDQELSGCVISRVDLDLVSDQDYLREFTGGFVGLEGRPDLAEDFGRPVEERYSPFRRSGIRISSDREDYSLQGSGYYYQMSQDKGDDDTAQPLAGLFYSLLPKRLSKLPIFFNIDTEYNYLWRDEGIKGHSLSINPEISYPKQISNYLKLESSVSYTGNLETYTSDYQGEDTAVKDTYQANVGLSTVLERIFSLDEKGATRLKHKITPDLVYEYGVGVDDEDEGPWFEPIDNITRMNRIGLSVENLLDASLMDEAGGVSYRQWAMFDITQRYNLDELQNDDGEDGDNKVWSPLLATLILRPHETVKIKGTASWDHYEDRFTTTVFSANLSLPRTGDTSDRYYVDYVKDSDDNKSMNLRAEVRLVDGFSAGGLLNRDLNLKYNIHKDFWLKYQAQCWSIRLGVEKEDSDRRITCKFQLAGF